MKYKVFFIVGLLVVIVAIVATSFFVVDKKVYPLKYQSDIETYSTLYKIDPALVASVINAESSFNPNATSPKGAKGLMQLLPTTAEWLCEKYDIPYQSEDLTNPAKNIKIGTLYIYYLSQKFDNTIAVLCAYNAGEGNVKSWLESEKYSTDGKTLTNIPFKETNNYVKKVNKAYQYYKGKF